LQYHRTVGPGAAAGLDVRFGCHGLARPATPRSGLTNSADVGERALSVALVSIARTRRRRFLWAAWWNQAPQERPFRKPDAHGGGAKTREDALCDAERVTGRTLSETEPRWARAWSRVMQGQPAWTGPTDRPARGSSEGTSAANRAHSKASIWDVLGLPPNATVEEIKREYRRRALERHPDRGGDAEAFRALQGAYERALARRQKRPRLK